MTEIGAVHMAFAVLALVFGALVLMQPKGTREHKFSGRVFALSTLILNVSALAVYQIDGQWGPFHYGAILNLGTLAAAMWPALRRPPGWVNVHSYYMNWTYVGILAAACAQGAAQIPWWDSMISVAVTVAIVVIASGRSLGWKAPSYEVARPGDR